MLVLSVQQPRTEILEILPVFGIGVKGLFRQDNSNNIKNLEGTIITQTNLIHVFALNNIFLFSNISGILIYTFL